MDDKHKGRLLGRLRFLAYIDEEAGEEGLRSNIAGAITMVSRLYGPESPIFTRLLHDLDRCTMNDLVAQARVAAGYAENLLIEVKAGLVGDIERSVSAGILSDFIALAQEALQEDAMPVAAVLSAAVFEDTLRRLALSNGLQHLEKLADVVERLKGAGHLVGPQIRVANNLLPFRNKAMHADWDNVSRPEIRSCLSFVEEVIRANF